MAGGNGCNGPKNPSSHNSVKARWASRRTDGPTNNNFLVELPTSRRMLSHFDFPIRKEKRNYDIAKPFAQRQEMVSGTLALPVNVAVAVWK